MSNNNRRTRIVLPLAILVVAALVILLVLSSPPKTQRFGGAKQTTLVVETLTVSAQTFTIDVASYGVVRPRIQSMLTAQVSGQISYISNQLRDGGFFDKGELLLEIDDRDYQAEVTIAKAGLSTAEQALIEEQANSEQAAKDWRRSGNRKAASDFVLRKPQLAAKNSSVLSAQAQLEKAQLALSRSKIIAPFTGRVLNKNVDLGQVVANNTQLAEIYATDMVEIRLPINNRDLTYINLPKEYRQPSAESHHSPVTFYSDLLGQQQWQGELIRTEAAIDEAAQQLYVVAKIDSPYAAVSNGQQPIKIGQYVKASIRGKPISDAIVIPNHSIYQGSHVYIVDPQQRLLRKNIDIAWQGKTQAVISQGLQPGMQLVVSPLGQVSSGTKVSQPDQAPARGKLEQQGKLPQPEAK